MLKSNSNFALRNLFPDTDRKTTGIRSVHRAANILICLSNGINTLTGIADCCKLTKPTVFRLLKTLEEMLMVTQDPVTHRYYLGLLVNQIASNPLASHHYLINCALEELRRLWDFSGETVELNIMIGIQYIRLYEMPSRYDLKVVAGPDPVGPIFVGATAKVLLSQLDEEDLKVALKNIRIRHVTEHSVTDEKELMAQTKEIRTQGYAISYGERILGALCISAPIKNYFWPVALSLIGPEGRLKPGLDDTLKELLASASRITGNIAEYLQAKGVIASEYK
jgi:DNA-binding IclR family transcriptional regulator